MLHAQTGQRLCFKLASEVTLGAGHSVLALAFGSESETRFWQHIQAQGHEEPTEHTCVQATEEP